jgi:DNA-binding NtrC family response regulator
LPVPDPGNNSLLYISPLGEDHDALRALCPWKLWSASHLRQAKNLLRRNQIPVVICERDLLPGSWRELLEVTMTMPHKPLVIVTSRLADERLWAEVINEGGWDVLAKPFDCTELIRVIESAFRHRGAYRTFSVAS